MDHVHFAFEWTKQLNLAENNAVNQLSITATTASAAAATALSARILTSIEDVSEPTTKWCHQFIPNNQINNANEIKSAT